jgi:hypothetical protein
MPAQWQMTVRQFLQCRQYSDRMAKCKEMMETSSDGIVNSLDQLAMQLGRNVQQRKQDCRHMYLGWVAAQARLPAMGQQCKDTRPKIRNKHSEKWNGAASLPIPAVSCRKIGGPIVGIYKSRTVTWLWNLGLRPRRYINRIFVQRMNNSLDTSSLDKMASCSDMITSRSKMMASTNRKQQACHCWMRIDTIFEKMASTELLRRCQVAIKW